MNTAAQIMSNYLAEQSTWHAEKAAEWSNEENARAAALYERWAAQCAEMGDHPMFDALVRSRAILLDDGVAALGPAVKKSIDSDAKHERPTCGWRSILEGLTLYVYDDWKSQIEADAYDDLPSQADLMTELGAIEGLMRWAAIRDSWDWKVEEPAVRTLRTLGWSWTTIANILDVSKQAVWEKYRKEMGDDLRQPQ